MTLALHQYLPDASRLIVQASSLIEDPSQTSISIDQLNHASSLLACALELGTNVINIDDIDGGALPQTLLGELFKRERSLRHHLILQLSVGTKHACEKHVKHYDLSADYLRETVENSIKKLHNNSLDVLVLSHYDPLMNVSETAKVLNEMHAQGKFELLAVANMHAGQLAYLQSALEMPVVANQLEMSLMHHHFVEDAISTNSSTNAKCVFPRGTMEYCMQAHVQLQATNSLCTNLIDGNDAVNELVSELAERYAVRNSAIVLAWLLRHPSNIQAVIDTNTVDDLSCLHKGLEITLSREHWYQLFECARGAELP